METRHLESYFVSKLISFHPNNRLFKAVTADMKDTFSIHFILMCDLCVGGSPRSSQLKVTYRTFWHQDTKKN